MNNYNGETIVAIEDSPFKDHSPSDWAMYFIESYGGIDGAHHKDWVLDQVSRVLKGTPMVIAKATWGSGETYMEEWRPSTGEPSKEYLDWVEKLKEWDAEEGEYMYTYDEGIAP